MPRLKKKEDKNEHLLHEAEVEFYKIKKAIAENLDILIALLRRRFKKYKDWILFGIDVTLPEENSKIDLVLVQEGEGNTKYLLFEFSIPHLGIGQKYTLDSKAKVFKKSFGIPSNNIKKAILLIKKANEQVVLSTKKLNVPVFEIAYETIQDLIEQNKAKNVEEKHSDITNIPHLSEDKQIIAEEGQLGVENAEKASINTNITESAISNEQLSKELVEQLKESIVHEALSTIHKRKNKYIRRGLWKWLERDILDPNVHFFLIILSCIYQGKSGDVLSKYFKTLEQYTKYPNEVIEKIFSPETCLAPEILQAAERHKKALQKFLECFVTTPPYEYLRSLFLKEFRASRDSLKSRIAVFETLKELLTRCGFVGEKEVQYPLEILDELGIFQGFLAGNYKTLRVENAIKKLQQLVPYKTWTPQDVYKIRDEVAKLLNLPPHEFNLNAFLPQSFGNVSPIKNQQLAVTQKVQLPPTVLPISEKIENISSSTTTSKIYLESNIQIQKDITKPTVTPNENLVGSTEIISNSKLPAKLETSESDNCQIYQSQNQNLQLSTELISSLDQSTALEQMQNNIINTVENKNNTVLQINNTSLSAQSNRQLQQQQQTQISYKFQYKELDESKHRFFESFGGQIEEDLDAIYLALEMIRSENSAKNETYTQDKNLLLKNKDTINKQNISDKESDFEEEDLENMPKKKTIMKEPQHNIRLTHHSELLELSEQILSKKLPLRKKKLKLKRLRELLLEQTRYNLD